MNAIITICGFLLLGGGICAVAECAYTEHISENRGQPKAPTAIIITGIVIIITGLLL